MIILAVVYMERAYAETRKAICDSGFPVIWCHRNGTGSLAKAFNDGARRAKYEGDDLAWCLTNVRFDPSLPSRLEAALLEHPELAAVQPPYASDHLFLRPDGSGLVREVPFVEFTAPAVRLKVLLEHPLDEAMPYWGHDLDWGYRVRAAGFRCGVDMRLPPVDHEYIRQVKQPEAITRRRRQLRRGTNAATELALIKKYGRDWATVLGYRS